MVCTSASAWRAFGELDLRVARVAHLDLLSAFAHRDRVRVVADDELDLAAVGRGDRAVKACGRQQVWPERHALGCGDRLGHLDGHPRQRAGLQEAGGADREVIVEDL
jgi:hypothetical protein